MPFRNDATAQNSKALITRMNRPSVMMVTGSVSSTRMGLIRVLTMASTMAATIAVPKLLTCTELIRNGRANSAAALINKETIKFMVAVLFL